MPTTTSGVRPASSASHRPTSSASLHQRPPSSASSSSLRPTSRISQRSHSRASNYRPPTSASLRQSPRVAPLVQALVTQVTGLAAAGEDGDGDGEGDNFREAVDYVSRNLEFAPKAGASQDMHAMDKHFHGHIQKARIHSNDDLAEALQASYQLLKGKFTRRDDLDSDKDIRISHLPDHLQLLILLSSPPTPVTNTTASFYLSALSDPPPAPKKLTWADILAEEPFEGDHWVGILGSGSGESTPSLDDDDGEDEEEEESSVDLDLGLNFGMSLRVPLPPENLDLHLHGTGTGRRGSRMGSEWERTYGHRQDVEQLQARQYWRAEWKSDVSLTKAFDLGDASTLGPSLRRILHDRLTISLDSPDNERYINEHDAVREVLMALQGRRNILVTWSEDGSDNGFRFTPSADAPHLVHLTLSSQASITASFAQTATILQHLRKFVSATYAKASEPPPQPSSQAQTQAPYQPYLHHTRNTRTQTLEAFADAVDREIRTFDSWCAGKEEDMCRAQMGMGSGLVVSLLSLEKGIRDTFGASFSVILGVLRAVMARVSHSSSSHTNDKEIWTLPSLPTHIAPARLTSLLLNTLFLAVQEYLSMVDMTTSDTLMRVFARSAEPVWGMVRRWLGNGMPVREGYGYGYSGSVSWEGALDEEFFVEDNGVGIVDPDFWAEGFGLRDGIGEGDGEDGEETTIPVFLAHVARDVLGSGKATGLLRALGAIDTDIHIHQFTTQSFSDLLAFHTARPNPGRNTDETHTVSVSLSTDTLSRVVYDELQPHCEATSALLASVLVDDCGLWRHLGAIEDLYLMRRGDAMSHFTDVLFAKMDSQQPWSDFHFLNSAFGDVLDAGRSKWIESSLVRFSYRGNKDRAINRTVKSIDGLLVEYAVPFPLTYVFCPRVLQTYGSLFVFLLQIRRAKSVLERILVRGAIASVPHLGTELKVFYAMRSKLSWFINILLNFLTTYVIHTQVLKFHDTFRKAKSLDEMIQLHDDHLEKIYSRCFLQPDTSALLRAILSILDMCLHFSDIFVAFAGDTTTHDISRQSITTRRHRSRRQRKQRRNIIGFSQSLMETEHTSDEDSEPDEGNEFGLSNPLEPSYSMAPSADGDFIDRIDKMTSELESLVKFVRRGTESLAGGAGEAATVFGVLAFALEDWDL